MPDIFPAPDQDDNALDALFATPQIHTDDDGRHFDAAGREYRIATVGLDGELTFELLEPEPSRGVALLEQVTASIASWSAPAWAMRSHVDGSTIVHTRDGARVVAAERRDEVVLQLTQVDTITTEPDGRIRVVRQAAPVILLEDLWLTPEQACALAEALLDLARTAGAR